MVLKLAGGIFVGVASLMSGWMARQGLSRQLRLLRELRLGLELMGQEMELHMPPMPELFETVGRQIGGEIGELFVGTAVNMASVTGRPLNIALKLQMEGMPLGISAELRAMLLELAGALGRYGRTGPNPPALSGSAGPDDFGAGGGSAAEGKGVDDGVGLQRTGADSPAAVRAIWKLI